MGTVHWLRDNLINLVTGLGTIKDPTSSLKFHLPLMDRAVQETAYRSDWLSRRIVDAPAEDATREWRAWQASGKQIEAIENLEKKFDLQKKMRQAVVRARLYGGAALVFGVEQGESSEELKIESVGRDDLKFIVVLSAHELNPGQRIYDVTSPYYSRPEYYTVGTPVSGIGNDRTVPMIGAGMTRIHPSRVVEFYGNEMPDWHLATMNSWGDSVLQTCEETLKDFGLTVGGIANMVNDAKIDVIKIPDFSQNIATEEYKNRLLQRFSFANTSKSSINSLLLDKEEEWERIQTTFASLPQLLSEFMTIAAGAAGIPVSRLMGQSPSKGLGTGASGGEQDMRNYYDTIAAQQKTVYTPAMTPLDEVLVRSALGSYDPNIYYEWNPLYLPDPKEIAAIAVQKAAVAQQDVAMGLINEDALRRARINQLIEDGTYPGLEDAIDEFGEGPPEPPVDESFTPGETDPNAAPPEPAPSNVNKLEIVHSVAKDSRADFFGDGFDPNQPRAPKGSSTGGQWTSESVSGIRITGLGSKLKEKNYDLNARKDLLREGISRIPKEHWDLVSPLSIHLTDVIYGDVPGVVGQTSESGGEITIGERTSSGEVNKDFAGSLIHEVAHALDIKSGRSLSSAVSKFASKDFAKMAKADQEHAHYYSAPREMFAELYKLAYGPEESSSFGFSHKDAMHYFKSSVAALKAEKFKRHVGDAFDPDQPRDKDGQWTAVEGIKNHLKMISSIYGDRPSPAKFILEHGKHYKMTDKTFACKKGKQGECYKNATHMALAGIGTYVEGYVTTHGIPIEHAWVADREGNVIDPTIKGGDKIGGYFGVPFGLKYLNQAMVKNKVYGVLGFESMKTAIPLIEGKVKFKDYDPDQPRDPKGTATGGRWTEKEGFGKIGDAVAARLEESQRIADSIPETSKDSSPQRQALRQHIEDMLYENNISNRTHGRNATIILGLPGAGKSDLARGLVEAGALEIDPDIVKEHIPEFAGGIGAMAVHEESSMINRKILQRAITNGDDIVWPRVDGKDKIVQDVKSLAAAGYKVHAKFIDVSRQTAINSVLDRFLSSGRLVKPATVILFGSSPRESFNLAKQTGLLSSYEEYKREYRKGLERVG